MQQQPHITGRQRGGSRKEDRRGAGADGEGKPGGATRGTSKRGQQGGAASGVGVRAGRLCRLGMLPQEARARIAGNT